MDTDRYDVVDELERALGLPVAPLRSGQIAVLDRFAKHAEVLTELEAMELLQPCNVEKHKLGLSASENTTVPYRKAGGKGRDGASVSLYCRRSCLSGPESVMAIKGMASDATNISRLRIFLDTGPDTFEWDSVIAWIKTFCSVNGDPHGARITTNVFIDASFSCPSSDHMDFLVRHKVILRYILGSRLGYATGLDGREGGTLSRTCSYGLRVPVLYYWSGEDAESVANVLRNALVSNKLSGIGLLPYFMSPYFNPADDDGRIDGTGFLAALDGCYADHSLSEFMDEPFEDMEDRISHCGTRNHIHALVEGDGRILRFRAFPFTALLRHTPQSTSGAGAPNVFSSHRQPRLYGRCRSCSWKHICGGLDSCSSVSREQYHSISSVWCSSRKAYLRRVASECLDLRACVHKRSMPLGEDM